MSHIENMARRCDNDIMAKPATKINPTIITKIGPGGRIVIPADVRKQLGMDVGDEVCLGIAEDVLTVQTRRAALRRLQDKLRKKLPKGVSLVDELIAERRKEAENE